MSSFKDTTGRAWLVDISINEIRRVKCLLSLDLLDLDQGKALEKLANDPVLLVDCLFVLCSEQCEKHGLSDEQFGRLFRGDVIEHATEALFEALVDFFPPQRQHLLKQVMRTAKALGQKQTAMVELYLTGPALDEMVDRELETLKQKLEALTAGNSSTASPESAASTPDASPSAT